MLKRASREFLFTIGLTSILLLPMSWLVAGDHGPAPVAALIDISMDGEVFVVRAGAAPAPAEVGQSLLATDRLRASAPAHVTLLYGGAGATTVELSGDHLELLVGERPTAAPADGLLATLSKSVGTLFGDAPTPADPSRGAVEAGYILGRLSADETERDSKKDGRPEPKPASGVTQSDDLHELSPAPAARPQRPAVPAIESSKARQDAATGGGDSMARGAPVAPAPPMDPGALGAAAAGPGDSGTLGAAAAGPGENSYKRLSRVRIPSLTDPLELPGGLAVVELERLKFLPDATSTALALKVAPLARLCPQLVLGRQPVAGSPGRVSWTVNAGAQGSWTLTLERLSDAQNAEIHASVARLTAAESATGGRLTLARWLESRGLAFAALVQYRALLAERTAGGRLPRTFTAVARHTAALAVLLGDRPTAVAVAALLEVR